MEYKKSLNGDLDNFPTAILLETIEATQASNNN